MPNDPPVEAVATDRAEDPMSDRAMKFFTQKSYVRPSDQPLKSLKEVLMDWLETPGLQRVEVVKSGHYGWNISCEWWE